MEMEMKMKRVYDAAVEGRIPTLKSSIQEDPLILDRITSIASFPETPLHISVVNGHLEFTRALLSHNPNLATESDSLGRLPLHIASLHAHLHIIHDLLLASPDTCLARDKDGMTPLHLAIVEGVQLEVVKQLTRASPESTRFRLDTGETILHLCVKHNNLQGKLLLEDLEGENDNNNLLNSTDDDGNTIFHLATVHKHLEMIKYLVTKPGIEVNAVNNNGHTALDLIENSPRDMKGLDVLNLLLESNGERGTNCSSVPQTNHKAASLLLSTDHQRNNTRVPGSRPRTKSWKQFFTFADGNHHLEEIRGALFVSLGLVMAMAVLPVMMMKVNDREFWDRSPVSPWSLVPAMTILVLFISGMPLDNKFCVWLVVQLVYTTIGILSLNFIGNMISVEDRYGNVNPPFYIICVWFLLLSLASLLNLIRLIVLIVTTIKGCVKKRN